jgi:hypothetical protein
MPQVHSWTPAAVFVGGGEESPVELKVPAKNAEVAIAPPRIIQATGLSTESRALALGFDPWLSSVQS